MIPTTCPECGAVLEDNQSCQGNFYQMLFWEAEDPINGEVHHLTVLCYHLQHPSLYSREGLQAAQQLLDQFIEQGLRPQEVRLQNRARVSSNKRKWKVAASGESRGSYDPPIAWSVTTSDIIAAGRDNYRQSVRRWAQSIHGQLKSRDKSS